MRGDSNGFHPFNGRVSRKFENTTLKASDPYLSYYDTLLTKEDIDVLQDDWLTDNIIQFWEEYLEHAELAKHPRAQIVLLRPTMTFMLLQTKDPSSIKDALPSFEHTTHIFLPVNDCHNPAQAEGGSHWSLLLISLVDGMAFHYDSLNSANQSEAALVTRQMEALLGRRLSFMDLRDSPQQENGSDCGVFVCINMRHLLTKRLLQAQRGEKVSMSMGGRDVDAAGGRKEILRVIEGFRREGEMRRSVSPMPETKPGEKKGRSPPRIE